MVLGARLLGIFQTLGCFRHLPPDPLLNLANKVNQLVLIPSLFLPPQTKCVSTHGKTEGRQTTRF